MKLAYLAGVANINTTQYGNFLGVIMHEYINIHVKFTEICVRSPYCTPHYDPPLPCTALEVTRLRWVRADSTIVLSYLLYRLAPGLRAPPRHDVVARVAHCIICSLPTFVGFCIGTGTGQVCIPNSMDSANKPSMVGVGECGTNILLAIMDMHATRSAQATPPT